VSDSIVGFQVDSLSRTHAFLSWGVTKRVLNYKISYRADSVNTHWRVAPNRVASKTIKLPRDSNATIEIWKMQAVYTDGTVSPAAITTGHGPILVLDEIFVKMKEHCVGGVSSDPEMVLVFEGICVAAEMNTICKLNADYVEEHNEDMPIAEWEITLLAMAADEDIPEVQSVDDFGCEYGGQKRGIEALVPQTLYITTWPNPVQDKLIIACDHSSFSPIALTISDMQGRTLARQTIQPEQSRSETTIPMSTYSPGMYMLRIEQNGTLQSKRIVKK
jgi:hypothetical protein